MRVADYIHKYNSLYYFFLSHCSPESAVLSINKPQTFSQSVVAQRNRRKILVVDKRERK